MGGQTNFEFVCLDRMTIARFAGVFSANVNLNRPSDTLSHPMGAGRGEGRWNYVHISETDALQGPYCVEPPIARMRTV